MRIAPERSAGPEPPEDVVVGLRNIKSTMHLRWNPCGKLVKSRGFDAAGQPLGALYDARWELWDTDSEGADYLVMVVRDAQDAFMHPGQWLVDRMREFNPERYNGDPLKMIEALEADSGERLRRLHEADFRSLCGWMAQRFWGLMHPVHTTGGKPITH